MVSWVVTFRRYHRQLAPSSPCSRFLAFPSVICLHSATPLESTREKVPPKMDLTTFRINTSKSASKQRTLSTFRINTCEKGGEGGQLLSTRHPTKGVCPGSATAEGPRDLS